MENNMMHDLYEMADENVAMNDAPAGASQPDGKFPIKVVNAYRQGNPLIVDVMALNTVESVISALLDADREAKRADPNDGSFDLGLGDLPISEMAVTVNGCVAKPSTTMKALGLHAGMPEMAVLMIDPSGSNG